MRSQFWLTNARFCLAHQLIRLAVWVLPNSFGEVLREDLSSPITPLEPTDAESRPARFH